jgi:DNA-binding MarR family transcriptional regulator
VPTTASDLEAATQLRDLFLRLARRVRRHARPGLTPSQHSLLTTLARHGPLAVGELARREQLEKSSVTRGVARLEAAGCLTRLQDPDDGRVVLLTLTEAGNVLLDAADARAATYLAGALQELDGDERAAVRAALPALERLLAHRP